MNSSCHSTERGLALIGAIIVAAIVTGLAVGIGQRIHFGIASTVRTLEAEDANEVFRSLQYEARSILRLDLETTLADHADEPWVTQTIVSDIEPGNGNARLQDLQGLYNLNNLVMSVETMQPAQAIDASPDEDTPEVDVGTAVNDVSYANPAEVLAGNGDDTQPQSPKPTRWTVAVARFALLLSALEIEDSVIPAILDWLDADSDTRFPGGAEDDYYMSQEQPYRAANRSFADITELRLVRGITPEIYARLAPFVSALPHPSDINVNFAPIEVLMAIGPGIDRGTAEILNANRKTQPFRLIPDFIETPTLLGRPILDSGLTTNSTWFALQMHANAGESHYSARAVIARNAPDQIQVLGQVRGYFGE